MNISIRAIGDQKIATEDNFLVREVDDGIAARVRVSPVVKADVYTIEVSLSVLL